MNTSNRSIGWASLAIGVAVGLVMGLWSFDGPLSSPAWIGEYADTSRRFARLGHIAFIGLGIINILLDDELRRAALRARLRSSAAHLMNVGNVLLPLTLCGAAVWHPAKYLTSVPATCVLVALVIAAWGARRRDRSPEVST